MSAGIIQDPLSLIHPYFVGEYHLDKMNYEVLSLPARELLNRFDLFSKLFYIRNRHYHPRLARRVYLESLRSFVPFGKEWGKETEKNSFHKHIEVFNSLIDSFAVKEFDPSESIVPIDSNYAVIDGAHRVAALAFYDKRVTVCRFDKPVYGFYYDYFLTRGMSRYAADLTVLEEISWRDDVCVRCVWPSSKCDNDSLDEILYVREFTLGAGSYRRLRESIDPTASITGMEGKKAKVRFIFYKNTESICEKEFTCRIADAVLSDTGRAGWYFSTGIAYRIVLPFIRLADKLSADLTFIKYRKRFRKDISPHLKDRLEERGNRFLLFLYNLASPLWVRDR